MSQRPSRSESTARSWRLSGGANTVLSSVGAVLLALVIGAIFIAATGADPIEAYRALLNGAFGDRRSIGETFVYATPYIFGGLAFAVAARGGMFNIGVEGQLVIGGLACGLVGAVDLGLPRVLFLPLALITAAVAGAIWGAIPGVLKARTGSHEVITTIMLNYIAFRIVTYVMTSTDDWLPVNPQLQATDKVEPAAKLPIILSGTRLHAGFIVAILTAVFIWYLLFRTTMGYRIRTVGLSRGAADYAGMKWGKTITIAMALSGALAGLAGAGETLGLQGRHYSNPPGYGFTAIAVGLVGRNHPIGVILAGILFGVLRSGATEMQNQVGTSKELVQVLQGLVILSVSAIAAYGRLQSWRSRRQSTRREPPLDATTIGVEPGVPPVV
jgi:general nucleoside transport system permease protein